MNRRQLLQRVGATAGAMALAGCSSWEDQSTSTRTTTRPPSTPARGTTTQPSPTANPQTTESRLSGYAERFADVLNVADLGAATDASRSINALLDEHVADDTLLFFPPGRYRMTDSFTLPSFSNVGITGERATIVPPDGYSGYLFTLGQPGAATDLLVENLSFDFSAKDTGARPIQALVDDGMTVRDVTVRGVQDTGQDMMRFDVTAPDGGGLVERMKLPDGGAVETPTTGCLVGPTSEGALTFRDCHIEGFPDNGLYASPAKGPVHVVGGYYANNGISSVRLGGGGVVRDAHIRCDTARRGIENMRGIRLRQGDTASVENCRVELLDATYSDGAITVAPWLTSATIRNTKITVDVDHVPAVKMKTPTGSARSSGPDVRCENVHIDGAAAHRAAVEVVDRDSCVFDGLCITQTGASRNGIHLLRSNDTVVRDAAIDVTGEPIVLDHSTAHTSNIVTSASKPGSGRCG